MLVETNGEEFGKVQTNGAEAAAHNGEVEDLAEPKEEEQDEEAEEVQANKRVKMERSGRQSGKTKDSKKPAVKTIEPECEICLQKLNDNDLKLYIGHPNKAVDEYSVLLDPKLCLFNGDEVDITEGDARALNKVTSFR